MPKANLAQKLLLSRLVLSSSFLESCTSLEADSLGSLDLDGCTSLRIAASTCSAGLHRESTETDELDVAILLDASGNAIENCVDSVYNSLSQICELFGNIILFFS